MKTWFGSVAIEYTPYGISISKGAAFVPVPYASIRILADDLYGLCVGKAAGSLVKTYGHSEIAFDKPSALDVRGIQITIKDCEQTIEADLIDGIAFAAWLLKLSEHLDDYKPAHVDTTPAPVGRKDDLGKSDWTLFPWDAADAVVRVLMHGADKYGRDNWRVVPDARQRYAAAMIRHAAAFLSGEQNDKESGLPHMAHAACCALFVLADP